LFHRASRVAISGVRRAIGFILLLACSGKGAADTDTDTDTDTEDDTFGSFDESFETTADDNDVWGSSSTGEEPAGTSSSTQTTEPDTTGESDTDTDTASTTMMEGSSSGGETDPTHGDPGDCCEAHPGEVGCENKAVEECVCDEDPQCCDLTWDDACVVGVVIYGCGQCEGIGGDGDCCEAHDNPGCDDNEIETCVCAMDIACCNAEWDQICVDQVAELRCGMC
jgi:hypothetical protein